MTDLPSPPLYLDIAALRFHLSTSETTINIWVKEGKLPAPRWVGGKRLWKTSEVCDYIDNPPEDVAGRIRNEAAQRSVRGSDGRISWISKGYAAFHEHPKNGPAVSDESPDDDPRRDRNAPRIPIYPGRNKKGSDGKT